MQSLCLLGSTGSIGRNTLDVIARHPERYRVESLAAYSRIDLLFDQIRQFRPSQVVVVDPEAAQQLASQCRQEGLKLDVLAGAESLAAVASADSVDTVLAAIVGAAGLVPTMAAVESGKRVLLANKESLVMSGELMMQAAADSGALLLPVDSEHNAIFQSLPVLDGKVSTEGVTKILLTASGGPFRTATLQELAVVNVQQALAHPNWSMGPKISVDSASLMNKGLEVIEACHLFAMPLSSIEVVVHPESIIHSMVSYTDGSVIAQLGRPDMRTPIAHCLSWPERIESGVEALDFTQVTGLHFEKPDTDRFPCLDLAFQAQRTGGTAPTILNAANEVAVEAFLAGRVVFMQLSEVIARTLDTAKISPASEMATIIEADQEARRVARRIIAEMPGRASV